MKVKFIISLSLASQCLAIFGSIPSVVRPIDQELYDVVRKNESNALEEIRRLIKEGANVNVKIQTPEEGILFPLAWAVFNNNLEITRELIKNGADVNATFINGSTILFDAAGYPTRYNILVELLKQPSILVNKKNDQGETPLGLAVSINNKYAVRALLLHPDIDSNEVSTLVSQISPSYRGDHSQFLLVTYMSAKEAASGRALQLFLAKHPRLGTMSPAAQLDNPIFQEIKRQLEKQLIHEYLMQYPIDEPL